MCFCLRVKFFIPARYFSIRVFSWDIPTPWMFSWDIPTRAQGIYEDNTRGVGYIPGKHPYQTYYRTQYQYGHLTDQRKKSVADAVEWQHVFTYGPKGKSVVDAVEW